MTKENLIPLSVSLNTEAGMIEKSVFQSEKNRKQMSKTPQTQMKRLTSEEDMRRNFL
jgi:hypothetical protein